MKDIETALGKLEQLIAVQTTNGNWNYNSYMMGLANGLIVARAVITDVEPVFLVPPEQWLEDIDLPTYPAEETLDV